MTYSPTSSVDDFPESRPFISYASIEGPAQEDSHAQDHDRKNAQVRPIYWVLPVAFFASMGMAATSATTIFAYATLLCADPLNCHGAEKEHYAGTVALSVTVTNFCAILVLGLLQLLPRRNPKAALYFWLLSRSASVAILAIGVYRKSIWIAITARVFEGCATDNILQLALNSIYVRAPLESQVSHLFGISLALYMMGQALSPTIAGIFPDFTTSFTFAIAIFALCFLYLLALNPLSSAPDSLSQTADGYEEPDLETTASSPLNPLNRLLSSLSHPLSSFFREPALWAPGLALFAYLGAISYIYPALMVFAAVRFNFTGRENGWIISTAASSSSVYLFFVLYVFSGRSSSSDKHHDSALSRSQVAFGRNFRYAMASMSLLGTAIPSVGFARQSWQLFPIVAVASMGLSTPSFIKSYAVSLVDDGGRALTALALMETCGALLSPIILGGTQSKAHDGVVFTVSAGLVATAMLILSLGAFVYALPSKPRARFRRGFQ